MATVDVILELLPIVISAAALAYVVKDVRQGRRSNEGQLRSYLRIVGKSVPRPEVLVENGGQAFIAVENYGHTPALDVTTHSISFVAAVPLPDGDLQTGNWFLLGSRVVAHPGISADFGIGIAPIAQTVASLATENRGIYVVTRVKYTDVFGQRHLEQACFRIDYQESSSPRFLFVDRYNEST